MRILPLGSPTGVPNVSYVQCPRVPQPWSSRACRGRAVCGHAGYGRVVYRVGTRGGVLPAQTSDWYCQGPTNALWALSASTRHSRALLALPHTWLLALNRHPASSQIGRDSIKYILKLVKTAECHLKCLMRPVILPILKPAEKSRP